MRLVLDNVNVEHHEWLTEMAKALDFKIIEIEISEDEEDAYLLAAMEEVKGEPNARTEEIQGFRNWLQSSE